MFFNFLNKRISYEVFGKGEYLVFLHGWGSNKESFVALYNDLKHRYTCVVIDFPGFGESDSLDEAVDLNYYVESVKALLAYIEVKSYSIVCHSFGGRVGLELSRGSTGVKSAVFIAIAGVKPRRAATYYLKVFWYKLLKKLVKLSFVPQKVLDKFGSSDYKSLPQGMQRTFVNIVNTHQDKILKDIKVPCLLIYGKGDKEVDFHSYKVLKQKIKNSTLICVTGGHFCLVSNSLKVISCINSFL